MRCIYRTSSRHTDGTSLQGTLDVSFDSLRTTFGRPEKGSVDGKTDAEWYLEIVDTEGQKYVATIYNWKNGKNYLGDKGLRAEHITNWNIGVKDRRVVDLIKQYIIDYAVSASMIWTKKGTDLIKRSYT